MEPSAGSSIDKSEMNVQKTREDEDSRQADADVGVVVGTRVAVVQKAGQEVMAEEKRVGWKKHVRAMEAKMRAAEEAAKQLRLKLEEVQTTADRRGGVEIDIQKIESRADRAEAEVAQARAETEVRRVEVEMARVVQAEQEEKLARLQHENKELESRVQALQQSVAQHKGWMTSFREQHQEAEAEWQAEAVRWQAELSGLRLQLGGRWERCVAPDGGIFFYDKESGQSQWEIPS